MSTQQKNTVFEDRQTCKGQVYAVVMQSPSPATIPPLFNDGMFNVVQPLTVALPHPSCFVSVWYVPARCSELAPVGDTQSLTFSMDLNTQRYAWPCTFPDVHVPGRSACSWRKKLHQLPTRGHTKAESFTHLSWPLIYHCSLTHSLALTSISGYWLRSGGFTLCHPGAIHRSPMFFPRSASLSPSILCAITL